MDGKKTFEKYYDRLAREGIVKAVLLGLVLGFAVNFAVAFGTWFAAFNGLWVSIGAGILVFAISSPLFYFKLFRPTAKKIARRIDKLGLEERLITMTELENDPSYLAMRQREDAKQQLSRINAREIKFQLSKAVIVCTAVFGVLGIFMTTITGLSASGAVPGGGDFFEDVLPDPPPEYLEVSYLVEEGGYIEGEAEQVVEKGQDATTVVAVAEDGWMFAGWEDGVEDPSRTDMKVEESFAVTALFVEVEPAGGDSSESGEGEGESGENGDQPQDQPSSGEGESQGEPQENPDEQQGDGNGEGDGAGGRYEENNQIIDGDTYYRDALEAEYFQRMLDRLESGEELTPEERAIIEGYYDSIK